ncbi:type VI secretion system baseplate subunit TssK [Aggregatimonas sangjinii]|uniref:Type VI secretion system baseplate subunit TssK n=1 Tax=Aggregatimonas sangjinii TaxID=2583587 RepID=A0A5B7SMZ6_9FLAO|nr:type VI secretion system baseplate subunit TssK [Aggregatimonas sangjinii]QCW99886.1 type VI secretion system baseplate subunit TssK [Aggregatimonas sangjinii]
MIEDIKNFKINWVDGMKISKEHFQNLQNFAENSIKDAYVVRKGRYGHGFLASYLDGNNDYAINLDIHKSLKVTIKKLRAITPNGNRIEITENTPAVKEEIVVDELADKKLEEGFLLINLDTENTIPFGEQDPKEIPPRHPFLTNNQFFIFITSGELEKSGLSGNQLPIAKIEKDGKSLATATDYIPPCLTLAAHESLVDFYNESENFLKMTERNAIMIVQKIISKQSDNPIADAMHLVVDKAYVYLAQQITKVKWEEYDMHPKELLEIIVSFARVFKGSVDVSSPQNKEELFNYFGEWTDLKGGDYEKMFTDVINMQYNHNDVNQNIKLASGFMNVIDRLLTVLTQIDYIGKRRDMGIFVNENIVKDKPGKSGGTSFLAE